MRWICNRPIWFGFLVMLSATAYADDPAPSGDAAREQLARVIAVLRLKPAAAGQSCLDALHEVHQTEDQVKALQNKANNPDVGLAQDVLETDYENAKEICGADSNRVCTDPGTIAGLRAVCVTVGQSSHGR